MEKEEGGGDGGGGTRDRTESPRPQVTGGPGVTSAQSALRSQIMTPVTSQKSSRGAAAIGGCHAAV